MCCSVCTQCLGGKKKNQVILNEPSPDTMSITIDMYIIITFSIVNNLTLSMLSIHNTVSLSCHEQVCLTTDTEQTSENIFMSIHTCLSLKIIPQSSGLHLFGLLPWNPLPKTVSQNFLDSSLVTSKLQAHNASLKNMVSINPIQDGLFRGCSWYPTMMKLGRVVPYPRKTQKIYKSCDKSLEFCWHQHFFNRNQQILLHQEIKV